MSAVRGHPPQRMPRRIRSSQPRTRLTACAAVNRPLCLGCVANGRDGSRRPALNFSVVFRRSPPTGRIAGGLTGGPIRMPAAIRLPMASRHSILRPGETPIIGSGRSARSVRSFHFRIDVVDGGRGARHGVPAIAGERSNLRIGAADLEGPSERPHRARCRHQGRWRGLGRPPARRPACRSAPRRRRRPPRPYPERPDRRGASELRRPRGHRGRHGACAVDDRTARPRALAARRARPCRRERPARGRLRSRRAAGRHGRPRALAARVRADACQAARARHAHGRLPGGRSGPHDRPRPAPGKPSRPEPRRVHRRRDRTAHRRRGHGPERGRHRTARGRDPDGVDRRMGRPALAMHDTGDPGPMDDDADAGRPAFQTDRPARPCRSFARPAASGGAFRDPTAP